jgi:S1-C subfamily serine protease/rhodanese-related sulfurtransferase
MPGGGCRGGAALAPPDIDCGQHVIASADWRGRRLAMMRRVVEGVLLAAALAPTPAGAMSVQEAIQRARPAVVLATAEVRADVTMNCGQGPVTVSPAPFRETGTGWFVDGRGFLITNAHVVDPAHTVPPWVTHELKKKAIDEACVDPVLRRQGLMRGQRPDLEDQISRQASERALATAKVTPISQLTVLLSNGTPLAAEVLKFSPPLRLDAAGRPVKGSGRDLALLRVKDGAYPALAPSSGESRIGNPVHILGFPGVVMTHELLNQNVTMEASVTNGAISGFQQDAIGQTLIQTDAPAAHGNSGGPAIGDDSTVVGVLTAVTLSPQGGAIVQGFNFLIPSSDVIKFLQGTEVTRPGQSRFHTAWAAGLSALFAERYPTAAARLTEANQLLPNLPDVKRALQEAEFKVQNPPPRPFPWAWVTVGVTLLSVGAYGGMWGRRWWKNRFRIQPGQVIGLIEQGADPVVVDARSQTHFETSPLQIPRSRRLAPQDAEAGRIDLQVDPGQTIVTYCASPEERTSERVAQLLRQRGFKPVRILKGGLGSWTNAGLPVETKSHLPSIGVEIYKNLSVGDIERRQIPPGQVIFREGDDAHGEAYVVHAGKVDIKKNFNGAEKRLTTLGEGELFGQMALFLRGPRTAGAVAATDVELLVIKNERLEWLIRNRPQLTFEILKQLAEMIAQRERGEVTFR